MVQVGVAFQAEIGFKLLKFWFPIERKRRIVKTENVESVNMLPNGYTRLVVRLRKDIVVPSTREESVQLVKQLNALLSEIRAVEQRRAFEAKKTRENYKRVKGRLQDWERRSPPRMSIG